MIGRFESVAAQVASSVTYSSVRRIAELPWLLFAGEFSSQFGQQRIPSLMLSGSSARRRFCSILTYFGCERLNMFYSFESPFSRASDGQEGEK